MRSSRLSTRAGPGIAPDLDGRRLQPAGVYVAASVETRRRLYPGYGFDPRALRILALTEWPEDFRVPVYVASPPPRVVLGPLIDRPPASPAW